MDQGRKRAKVTGKQEQAGREKEGRAWRTEREGESIACVGEMERGGSEMRAGEEIRILEQ